MSTVYRQHGSGLMVAERAADFDAVNRTLKQLDRSLVLQYRHPYYVVVKIISDREAPVVYTWMTATGEPLPLSSGLVEEFKRLRLDCPNPGPTIDERNAALIAGIERDRARAEEALYADHAPILERGRVQVSLAYRNRKRDWMKTRKGRPR